MSDRPKSALSPVLVLGVCAIATIAVIAVVMAVVARAIMTTTPVWRHGDAAYWQRWLGEVCHAAEAKPHINRFDDKLTIYETHWEADPADDAAASITAIDCTLTMFDGKHGPRTLVVLLTNTHAQLPGYAVMETTSAIARELTGDGAGVVTDLAASPARMATRPKATFIGGYTQPWQWSMRVLVRD